MKTLTVFLAVMAILAIALPVSAQQATCPQTGGWTKVDGLSGYSYTFTAPEGSLVAAWCYKAATTVVYGTVAPPAQSVTVTSTVTNQKGELQELSHASFLVVTPEPTITPTPTNTPVVTPTVTITPTVTSTSTATPPGETPEVTPTSTATLPPPTSTPGPCAGTNLYRLVVEGRGNMGVVRLWLSDGGYYEDDVNGNKPSFETALPDSVRVVDVTLNSFGVTVTTDDGRGLPTSASRCTQRTIYLPDPARPTEQPVLPTGGGGDSVTTPAWLLPVLALLFLSVLAYSVGRRG